MNQTRSKTSGVPFAALAKKLLPSHEISLAFVSSATAKKLNKSMRNKTYTPNVLAFLVSKKSGEVIICPEVAKKQAPDYEMTYTKFLAFLFIHALLHLKGMRHGATMEKEEQAVLATFATLHERKNRNRNRHRNEPNKGRRR